MLNRRIFLQSVASAAMFSQTGQSWAAGPKKNVILILADDLGWSDLACYGGDFHETPNLDQLAKDGLRFTDAYAASPVCSPTRASILTGKHPARLHMTIWREAGLNPPPPRALQPPESIPDLPLSEVTWAEVLKKAGYLTAHIGKWHLGDAAHYPETQGFDINIGGTIWGAPPTYFYPYRGGKNPDKEIRYVPDLPFGQPGEYLTDRLTDEAIGVIENAGDKPFFVNLAYHSVHTPTEGKPEYTEEFTAKENPHFKHQNADYAAMVKSLDENVGRLRQTLKELNIDKDTIILFFSDNGGYINRYHGKRVTDNSPLRSGKGSLYEGGIREPLILYAPGITQAGTVCHEPVISMDLLPTILDLLGITTEHEIKENLDGTSLVSLIKNPKSKLNREFLFWHYPHYYPTWEVPEDERITTPVSAIREGKWKLVYYYENKKYQLFDLSTDPGEKKDCATQFPDVANRLYKHLQQALDNAGALYPAVNPHYSAED